jgi:hypothetical protein
MQMKWIEPSTLCAARILNAFSRNDENSPDVISPEAMTNSRCWIAPDPPTCPAIGTL